MAQYNSGYTGGQIDAAVLKITNASSNLAHLGCGIGTCSTAAATAAKVVTLSNYERVTNGIVAVTFTNDVPANATLNINNKNAYPIYYKGSAITADIIKAGDTVMFTFNGSQYVVTGLGGGGVSNPNEIVSISLTQVGGNSADLIGANITITDNDSGNTLFSGTWNGIIIEKEIAVGTSYTISVSSISGYLNCNNKSYVAGYQSERSVVFQYRGYGVYIEATEHILYPPSTWSSSGKTANAIVIITGQHNFRMAITCPQLPIHNVGTADITPYTGSLSTVDAAINDFNGKTNTNNIITFNTTKGTNTTSYAAPYCHAFTFPDGSSDAYFISCGQLNILKNNKNGVQSCLTALGISFTDKILSSSSFYIFYEVSMPWILTWNDASLNATRNCSTAYSLTVIPVADYE